MIAIRGFFTHTHASGQVEYKKGYLEGVGSVLIIFLTLDLPELHVRKLGDSAIVEGRIVPRAAYPWQDRRCAECFYDRLFPPAASGANCLDRRGRAA